MKRFKKLLLAGVLITGLVCYLRPMISKEDKVNLQIRNTEEQPIKISSELYSKNYILIRQKDSKVMLKEREEEAIAPASLTKLMTVYTAFSILMICRKPYVFQPPYSRSWKRSRRQWPVFYRMRR